MTAMVGTALLCVDLQALGAMEGRGVFADPKAHSIDTKLMAEYFATLKESVLPNIRRLQEAFRQRGLEVIHTRIQSLTRDGRDRGQGHRRLGLHVPPGSPNAEFAPEVAPVADEIVIDKTASGVFESTNIDYLLRNLGVRALWVVGVYGNECVASAVRGACDHGYEPTLIHDASASLDRTLHAATVATLKDRYAKVLSCQEALAALSHHPEPG